MPVSKIRIMTYNLGWLQGEGSEGVNYKKRSELHFRSGCSAVAQIIKDNNIDIVGFQEIDFNSSKSHNINQFEVLKSKTQMLGQSVTCWDLPFLPFPYTNPWGKVHSGGAVLSKFPIKEKENVLFDAPKDMFFLKRPFYLKRWVQVVKILINNKEETILNLHLEAFDFKAKREQFDELARLIRFYKPLVVMGDFNTIPKGANPKVDIDYSSDPCIDELQSILPFFKDIFAPDDYTFPTGKENCRLDYIWVNKKATAKKIDLKVTFNPSDHLPLALELEV